MNRALVTQINLPLRRTLVQSVLYAAINRTAYTVITVLSE